MTNPPCPAARGRIVLGVHVGDGHPPEVVVVIHALDAGDLDPKTDRTRVLLAVADGQDLFEGLGGDGEHVVVGASRRIGDDRS